MKKLCLNCLVYMAHLAHRAHRAHSIVSIASIATIALALSSCSRYELELYDDGKADVHFTFDWLTRYKELPEEVGSMTFMWAHDNDLLRQELPTTRVTEYSGRFEAGTWYITVMNKSFGEYGTMKFYNRNSHRDIYAKSNTYSISTDNAWDKGRIYMEEPERIGVATDTLQVPKTVDDIIFRNYKEPSTVEDIHIERPDTILPMTTKLNILVKVRGISYMQDMDGYVTGLADGFWLNQRWRRTDVGNLKLTGWERDYTYERARRALGEEPLEANVGWMRKTVETFGLPHGRELLRWRTADSNYILLHFTLIDGRTIDFGYRVGLNIRYQGDDGTLDVFTQSDVTLELDLVIDAPFYDDGEVPILPYAQPKGSGQFDATVDPWGDDIDITIPM